MNYNLILDEAVGGKYCPNWLRDIFIADGAIEDISTDTKSRIANNWKRDPFHRSGFYSGKSQNYLKDNLVTNLNLYAQNELDGKTFDYNHLNIIVPDYIPTSWEDEHFRYPYISFFLLQYVDAQGKSTYQVWCPGINNLETFNMPGPWNNNKSISNTNFKNVFLPSGAEVGILKDKGYAGKNSFNMFINVLTQGGTRTNNRWCYLDVTDNANFINKNYQLPGGTQRKLSKYEIDDLGDVLDSNGIPITDSEGKALSVNTRSSIKTDLAKIPNYYRFPRSKYSKFDDNGVESNVSVYTPRKNMAGKQRQDSNDIRSMQVGKDSYLNNIQNRYPDMKSKYGSSLVDKSGYIVDPDWYLDKDSYKKVKVAHIASPLALADDRLTKLQQTARVLQNQYSFKDNRYDDVQVFINQFNNVCGAWNTINDIIKQAVVLDEDEAIEQLSPLLDENNMLSFPRLSKAIDQLEGWAKELKPGRFDKTKFKKIARED